MSRTVSLVHIDESPTFRVGFEKVVAQSEGLELLASGASIYDALALVQKHTPTVLVLDINIPGNGLEAIKLLVQLHAGIRIVCLTASERPEHVLAALQFGATAYLHKNVTREELVAGLRAASEGKRVVSANLDERIFGVGQNKMVKSASSYNFTAREFEVVNLLKDGQTNREIADTLAIAEKTVKHHVTVIMQKLHVRNRVEATRAILSMLTEADLNQN